jgi:hypothetical protein
MQTKGAELSLDIQPQLGRKANIHAPHIVVATNMHHDHIEASDLDHKSSLNKDSSTNKGKSVSDIMWKER